MIPAENVFRISKSDAPRFAFAAPAKEFGALDALRSEPAEAVSIEWDHV